MAALFSYKVVCFVVLCDLRKEMTKTLEAVFDGEVFRPSEPLELQPNTRVRITIEITTLEDKPQSFLRTARSLNLEGPSDWSERIEEYLYERQGNARK